MTPAWLCALALAASLSAQPPLKMRIFDPLDGTLFPADIRSPDIRWEDAEPDHWAWQLRFSFRDPKSELVFSSAKRFWTPPQEVWEKVKKASLEAPATLEICGLHAPGQPCRSCARVRFTTSRDPVGAPVFYRSDTRYFPPAADYPKMKWKLAWLSSYDPPITVMSRQKKCISCHTSSSDGKSFGLEIGPEPGNAGQYLFFRNPGKEVVLGPENVISWGYGDTPEEREHNRSLMSAISPDGRYVVASGRAKMPLNAAPIKDLLGYNIISRGILVYFDTRDKVVKPLPGADDPRFVHVPTSWSPDGEYITFFRAAISPQMDKLNECPGPTAVPDSQTVSKRELDKAYDVKYDIYRIPFNQGKGGRAVPVAGASRNGKSNYFGKVSPDGRWLVFVQSANGIMIMRQTADLYIVPARGGKARKLRCNSRGSDSWHSWSPNSRWLVFASKSSPHAQSDLILTHISEQGEDSPRLTLTRLRDEDGLSGHSPEFFNIQPGQLESIITRLEAAKP